jgi:hypothetical protein
MENNTKPLNMRTDVLFNNGRGNMDIVCHEKDISSCTQNILDTGHPYTDINIMLKAVKCQKKGKLLNVAEKCHIYCNWKQHYHKKNMSVLHP